MKNINNKNIVIAEVVIVVIAAAAGIWLHISALPAKAFEHEEAFPVVNTALFLVSLSPALLLGSLFLLSNIYGFYRKTALFVVEDVKRKIGVKKEVFAKISGLVENEKEHILWIVESAPETGSPQNTNGSAAYIAFTSIAVYLIAADFTISEKIPFPRVKSFYGESDDKSEVFNLKIFYERDGEEKICSLKTGQDWDFVELTSVAAISKAPFQMDWK